MSPQLSPFPFILLVGLGFRTQATSSPRLSVPPELSRQKRCRESLPSHGRN